MEQFLYSALELRGNSLRLVGNRQLWHLDPFLIIRLQNTSQHFDKGGLTSTILTQHHHTLRGLENTSLDGKFERTQSLAHGRVLVQSLIISLVGSKQILRVLLLANIEVQLDISESHILRWHITS